ncbi:MAG: ThiF family adenylyltransferase [Solirubrobacteraceae bacterium]
MTDRATFVAAFDDRTRRYTRDACFAGDRAVVIGIGPDAHTPAGHLLLCALVNQVARAHQRIVLVGDLERPLLCPDVLGHSTVHAATAGLAREIHPWRELSVSAAAPDTDSTISVAIGQAPGRWNLRVGAAGWRAVFGPSARVQPDARWGAAYAASLTAAYVFHAALGSEPQLHGEHSLWETVGGPGTDGPGGLTLGGGSILQVGAGAVGCALNLWALLLGNEADWTIVDADIVDISNLNRQLLFRAADAAEAAGKAYVAARPFGRHATPIDRWYDQAPDLVEQSFDLVLPLANDRGVRTLLHYRAEPVLLHATTSRSWQAQLHRHIPGIDDCIGCRLPEAAAPTSCSIAPVAPGEPDAALPFLSATAGLLLAAAIARRPLELPQVAENQVAVLMRQSPPVLRRWVRACEAGCLSA